MSPGSEPLVKLVGVESPRYFTAVTETICDLANARLTRRNNPCFLRTHRLEAVAATPLIDDDAPPSTSENAALTATPVLAHSTRAPVAAVDEYVLDDFLMMAQTRHNQQRVLRVAVDVFRPLQSDDPPQQKEPASIKKMEKGDAHWSTRKHILGWDLDSVSLTLHLPPHRLTQCIEARPMHRGSVVAGPSSQAHCHRKVASAAGRTPFHVARAARYSRPVLGAPGSPQSRQPPSHAAQSTRRQPRRFLVGATHSVS